MTRFGIRKKLKKLVQSVVGGEQDSPSSSWSASETPSPTRSSSAPSPPAAPKAAEPAPREEPPAVPEASPEEPPASPPAAEPMPDDPGAGSTWVQLKRLKVDEMVDGSIRRVDVFGNRMAVAFVDGSCHALVGSCPHAGGQLGDGDLDGHVLTCPVHGLEFDVRDGVCVSDPDMVAEPIPVKVKDNKVLVMVPA